MNRSLYILLVLSLLLQSCDFFYSTVEYKGKEAEPRLCVICRAEPQYQMIGVNVLHSEYFLHTNKEEWLSVKDAQVTLQVNNLPPVVASESYERKYYDTKTDSFYVTNESYDGIYIAPLVYKGNDTIRLHVSHPDYGSAEAVQVCPMQQTYTLTLDSVVDKAQLWMHLHLPAYQGNISDVLELQFDVEGHTDTDTIDYHAVLYSLDVAFDILDNYQTDYDYYAGIPLYVPVSNEVRDIAVVIAPQYGWFAEDDSIIQDVRNITVHGVVTAKTLDGYKYEASIRRINRLNRYYYIRDFLAPENGSNDRIDFSELLEDISEDFEVLGNAESYQVVGNLSPATPKDIPPFGCFYLYQDYVSEQVFSVQ